MTHRQTRGPAIVVGLLALVLMSQALPVRASVGLIVSPARIDLALKPSDTAIDRELTVVNRGSATSAFTLQVVDVYVSHGQPVIVPAGSTPYSAAELVTLRFPGNNAPASPIVFRLPAARQVVVPVHFDTSGHRPFLGGLLVAADTSPGATQIPEALVTVSGAPVDATGELLAPIALGLQAVNLQAPAFIESGPIAVSATLRDSGNVYERVFSTYEFQNVGRTFLRVQAPPSSAMPGKLATTTATSLQRLEASGQAVDAVPWLCICQVRVSTVAWLADRQTAPPVVQTAYVVIFPWRAVVVVLVTLGFLWAIVRLGKRLIRSGKRYRDRQP